MDTVLERLKKNSVEVIIRPELGACTLVTYSPTGKGTYQMFVKGKRMGAARAAWEAHYGPISDDKLLVCHKCDQTDCVNIEHLFLGTHEVNMLDMKNKGRASRKGNPTSKNQRTPDHVVQAVLSSAGDQKIIAARFGISTRTVRRIKNQPRI